MATSAFNDDQISTVLSTLTSREVQVIKMRFGLDQYTEHTLEQIGQALSVTRERVRQIETKALKKLRVSCSTREAGEF